MHNHRTAPQVFWDVFFAANFAGMYVLPLVLYARWVAAEKRRSGSSKQGTGLGDDNGDGAVSVLPGTHVTSMTYSAVCMLSYAFASKVMEVWGVNILWLAPGVVIPWVAGMLVDRCVYRGVEIRSNRGCTCATQQHPAGRARGGLPTPQPRNARH